MIKKIITFCLLIAFSHCKNSNSHTDEKFSELDETEIKIVNLIIENKHEELLTYFTKIVGFTQSEFTNSFKLEKDKKEFLAKNLYFYNYLFDTDAFRPQSVYKKGFCFREGFLKATKIIKGDSDNGIKKDRYKSIQVRVDDLSYVILLFCKDNDCRISNFEISVAF